MDRLCWIEVTFYGCFGGSNVGVLGAPMLGA